MDESIFIKKKRAEANILLFQHLLNQSNDIHFVIDPPTGRFLYVDEQACKSLKYDNQQLSDMCVIDIDTFIPTIKVWHTLADEIQRNKFKIFRGNYKREDGSTFIVESNMKFVADSGDHYIVAVSRDIRSRQEEKEPIEKNKEQTFFELFSKNFDTKAGEKNLVLKEILKQIEFEKKEMQDKIFNNIDCVISPLLRKLKKEIKPTGQKYFELLEKNIDSITSSFGRKISQRKLGLTPTEIEVCNMIKSGLRTKDVAQLLNISPLTVETHRNRVRKKLGINNQGINLITYLQSL